MEGTIRQFFTDVRMETIRGRDGRKYFFTKAEWRDDDVEPEPGLPVVFSPALYRAEEVSVQREYSIRLSRPSRPIARRAVQLSRQCNPRTPDHDVIKMSGPE